MCPNRLDEGTVFTLPEGFSSAIRKCTLGILSRGKRETKNEREKTIFVFCSGFKVFFFSLSLDYSLNDTRREAGKRRRRGE